jgi:hypothetical protein
MEKQAKTKRDWVLLTIFILAMIAMFILFAVFEKTLPTDEEFQKYFEEYVEQNGELGSGTAQFESILSKPKLFMMSVTKNVDENGNETISYTNEIDVTGIPKELRARYLDEVNAVVLSKSEHYMTIPYNDGHKVYSYKLYVSIIDLETNSILAEEIFFISGSPYRAKPKYDGDQYKAYVFDTIHDWVKIYFLNNSTLPKQSSDTGATGKSQISDLCRAFEISGFSGN